MGGVVVGTDGSSGGDAVVRQGAVLAAAYGVTLHVVGPDSVLFRAEQVLSDRGIRIQGHEAACELAHAVWEVAQRVDAELIVTERVPRDPLRRAVRSLKRWLSPDGYAPVELINTRAVRASRDLR